ncbi:MAG: trigger factor [Candidatus Aminicenantes bacterium]|nr:MAG: trigger factor [Candidatus Aminicenantes bacterium]
MKSEIKKLSDCKREIELEIEPEEVIKELEKIVAQFSNRAKIPGFRPGKAPKNLIKQRYYPEIKESLINSLVPKALNSELKAQNLNPIGMPVVNDLFFQEGQPLRLKAQFEVLPDVKLPEYKKIKVKKKKVSVSEQEISQSLEQLQSRSAEYIPVESRGVVDGDFVVVELKGKYTKTNKLLPTEKAVVLAGHPENEKTLNQNLIGLKSGEESNFILTYDKDHQNPKLAGEKIEYNLKVTSIKEKKLPKINDDFAKDHGEFESLKDLKKEIRNEITASKEKAAKMDMAEDIIKKIYDNLNICLPETLIEQEYVAILKRHIASLPQQQQPSKEDFEKLKNEAKIKAEQNIKNHLILQKIAENENMQISDGEIEEELKAIAKANKVTFAQVVDSVNKEGKREELRNNLLLQKTVDFLVENAIIE